MAGVGMGTSFRTPGAGVWMGAGAGAHEGGGADEGRTKGIITGIQGGLLDLDRSQDGCFCAPVTVLQTNAL